MSKVLDILSGPEKWTKKASFRDANGTRIFIAIGACSYCLVGAIHVAYEEKERSKIIARVQNTLIRLGYTLHPVDFNDHPSTTFEDIVNLVKEAGV